MALARGPGIPAQGRPAQGRPQKHKALARREQHRRQAARKRRQTRPGPHARANTGARPPPTT
eukprot:11183530-Lingulodinium_polyedra.AAC.1